MYGGLNAHEYVSFGEGKKLARAGEYILRSTISTIIIINISALKLGLSNSWYTDLVSPLVAGHSKSYRKDCVHTQVFVYMHA